MAFNNQSIKYRSPMYQLATFLQGWSLRLINSTYTGPCIKIRRASDNTETDIGFVGGVVDVSTIQTFCAGTTGFVTTWYDQEDVMYANNLTQGTASLQPYIYLSGSVITQNGKPAIHFNSSRYLQFYVGGVGITPFEPGQPFTFYAVSSNTVSDSVGAIFCNTRNTQNRIVGFCDRRTAFKRNFLILNNSLVQYAADMSVNRNDANVRLTMGFRDSGGVISSFDNGATGVTLATSGSYSNDAVLVGIQFGSNSPLTGYIQEIAFFAENNSTIRTTIEKDVNYYYSIY